MKKRQIESLGLGMEKEIPVYQIRIDPDDLSATGVHAVSNVKYPAIESNFVALSACQDDEILEVNKARFTKLADVNGKEMKGLLTGPILIPDFQILRLDEHRNPYFITFSSEVIEQIRDKFSKGGWHRNITDEHEAPLGGNTIVELWIVEDPEKDKAAALGLSVPKGTLMATMKVEDHEYFQREILSGNRRGFSIEGWFQYDEPAQVQAKAVQARAIAPKSRQQNLKSNMSTKKKGLFATALAVLMGALKADGPEHQESHVLEDGTSIIVVDETQEPFYLTPEGVLGDLLADGEYLLNNGNTVVVMEGKVTEVREVEVEVDPATDPAEEVVVASDVAVLAKAVNMDAPALTAALSAAKLGITNLSKPRTLKTKMKAEGGVSLAILVDTESKAIYVDPHNGYAWYVSDDLWIDEPLPAGEYLLQDGTTLVVFEMSESYTDWDGAEVTITHSMVNYTASTVPVETLVPWLKETMSAVQLAGTALAKANAEIATLKAANAKLKAEPAAPAKETPKVAPVAPVAMSRNPKIAKRDQRVAAALSVVDKLGAQ